MPKKELSRRNLMLLMQLLWLQLQIFNLKASLEEEEGEIILREVEEAEAEVTSIVVTILMVTISVVITLTPLNFLNRGHLVFKVQVNQAKVRDHNIKYVERMDIQVLIVIIGWTFLSRVNMLHLNWPQWWLIQLRFMVQMDGSQKQVVQIM